MESQFICFFLLCACAASALPALGGIDSNSGSGSSSRREDLSHLVTLLSGLNDLQDHQQQQQQPGSRQLDASSLDLDLRHQKPGAGNPFAAPASKRQGTWSYDYGLGGGRFGKRQDKGDENGMGGGLYAKRHQDLYGLGGGLFGKRQYGDYGLGGGRYGRDVDHVDIADDSEVVDETS